MYCNLGWVGELAVIINKQSVYHRFRLVDVLQTFPVVADLLSEFLAVIMVIEYDTDLCPCGEIETMSHIVESCPVTKLNGGLSRLHWG